MKQLNSDLDRVTVEVYRSHMITRTHAHTNMYPVWFLCTGDQRVAEAFNLTF